MPLDLDRHLHGACSCGRNTYVIELPPDASRSAQVVFDAKGPLQTATPLSAHLRIPLTWYHSTTHAFFADETHPSIRRAYAPSATSLRHFCGFCGSLLALWSEVPRGEGEYICVVLGSLDRQDVRDLGEMGFLPAVDGERGRTLESLERMGKMEGEERMRDQGMSDDMLAAVGMGEGPATRVSPRVGEGLPWFEAMIEGSALGRVRVRRGLGEREGREVEWEVIEWTEGGGEDVDVDVDAGRERREEEKDKEKEETVGGGKRKLEVEG